MDLNIRLCSCFKDNNVHRAVKGHLTVCAIDWKGHEPTETADELTCDLCKLGSLSPDIETHEKELATI